MFPCLVKYTPLLDDRLIEELISSQAEREIFVTILDIELESLILL